MKRCILALFLSMAVGALASQQNPQAWIFIEGIDGGTNGWKITGEVQDYNMMGMVATSFTTNDLIFCGSYYADSDEYVITNVVSAVGRDLICYVKFNETGTPRVGAPQPGLQIICRESSDGIAYIPAYTVGQSKEYFQSAAYNRNFKKIAYSITNATDVSAIHTNQLGFGLAWSNSTLVVTNGGTVISTNLNLGNFARLALSSSNSVLIQYANTFTNWFTVVEFLKPNLPPKTLASGGDISYDGDYIIHTFTNYPSTGGFVVASGTVTCDVLVVAGGGGGAAGGGGAGGYLYRTNIAVTGSNTVIVAAGGYGQYSKSSMSYSQGNRGGDSAFGTNIAYGGGGGGNANGDHVAGLGGGSGGGGGGDATVYHYAGPGGASTNWQGHNGGTNSNTSAPYPSGGGGGASQEGQNSSGSSSGNGGSGITNDISGIAVVYAGGGGGDSYDGGSPGTGGVGGGGDGHDTAAENGTDGLGGGGGGTSGNHLGGNGGSGIVIVRYLGDTSVSWPTPNIMGATISTGETASVTTNGGILEFVVPASGGSGTLTNETEPAFTNWLVTNTYVKSESEPAFTNWIATNTYLHATNDLASTNWVIAQGYVTNSSGYDDTALRNATGALNTAVSALNVSTATLNTAVSGLNVSTGALNTAVANLNVSTTTLNTAIGNLNTATTAINTAVANLNTSTATLNTAIGDLNDATNALNARDSVTNWWKYEPQDEVSFGYKPLVNLGGIRIIGDGEVGFVDVTVAGDEDGFIIRSEDQPSITFCRNSEEMFRAGGYNFTAVPRWSIYSTKSANCPLSVYTNGNAVLGKASDTFYPTNDVTFLGEVMFGGEMRTNWPASGGYDDTDLKAATNALQQQTAVLSVTISNETIRAIGAETGISNTLNATIKAETTTRYITLTGTAAQVQAQVDAAGKYIQDGVTLHFVFPAGTNKYDSPILFRGYFGGGYLSIEGEGYASTTNTSQPAILDFSTVEDDGIQVLNCSATVFLLGLKIYANGSSGHYSAIDLQNCPFVRAQYNFLTATNGVGKAYGVHSYRQSSCFTYRNVISGCYIALYSLYGSIIAHDDIVVGAANTYGYYSNAGIISHYDGKLGPTNAANGGLVVGEAGKIL